MILPQEYTTARVKINGGVEQVGQTVKTFLKHVVLYTGLEFYKVI